MIETETELENVLTEPRPELIEFIKGITSPLVLLGAGGKMGPTLAVLARRAAEAAGHSLEIVAASRFSDSAAREFLDRRGIRTLSVDLLRRDQVQQLPESRNIIYLAGLKFGTSQNPSLTWAVNTLAPAHVMERYKEARVVALSTGNVYPLAEVKTGGVTEEAPLTPVGEYANAAVARERIFEFFSIQNGTALALLRLSYAVELRYGVLVDIARHVWANEPVDLRNGFINCIWQGDANDMIVRALSLVTSPGKAWNLTGPEPLSVRSVAEQLAALLGREARFLGTESPTALLSNPKALCTRLGKPTTQMATMLPWIAHWVKKGGRNLNKPTHFEVRDGAY